MFGIWRDLTLSLSYLTTMLNNRGAGVYYHKCESRHFRLPVDRVASLRFALVHFHRYIDGCEQLRRPDANLTHQTVKKDQTLVKY